jgi:hypothetical protein
VNRRWLGLGFTGLLAAGCLWGGSTTQVQAQSPVPEPGEELRKQIAVVEAERLLQQHPEYENLRKLEEQIRTLEAEVESIPMKSIQGQQKIQQNRFAKALQEAKAEMEAEKNAVTAELDGLARAMQTQMSSEMLALKVKLDGDLQRKMEEVRKKHGVAAPADQGMDNLKEYGENLRLVASRNVTARRLELEKASQAELAAERSRLDQQLAAYEDEVTMKYQEEKLNLQLKMQNSPSEEVEKTTRERLNQIDDEIAAVKAEKHKEHDAAMESFRQKKQAEFDGAFSKYEAQVRAEVADKVRAKQAEMGHHAPPPLPAQAEVRKEIEAAQRTMEGEMAAKRAQLEGAMKSKQAEAQARLQAKSRQIEESLKRLEADIKQELGKRRDFLDKATQAKLAQAEKNLEKARADRKQVYDKMLSDVGQVVGKVAEKQQVPYVIGRFLYADKELADLTDLSMVEVKQIGSR